jgi:hypothetical protein
MKKIVTRKLQIRYSAPQMLENPTVKLNTLYNSCAKLAFCSPESIFTFLYAGCSVQNASKQFVSCIHVSFVNFALHKNTEKKI